jgi:hypothetical protein
MLLLLLILANLGPKAHTIGILGVVTGCALLLIYRLIQMRIFRFQVSQTYWQITASLYSTNIRSEDVIEIEVQSSQGIALVKPAPYYVVSFIAGEQSRFKETYRMFQCRSE